LFLQLQPGEEGKAKFEADVRRLLGIKDDMVRRHYAST
jgi:hypothetical protein